MNLTGRIKTISKDWSTNKWNITLEINEQPREDFNFLVACEKLAIEIKKFRNKRSLDANAYAWVLMQKIAEAAGTDKWSVYLDLLVEFSREFTFVLCRENCLDKLKELYRTCVDLGEVEKGGEKLHQIQVYFGSSTFDSKAMSVFIDGIILKCHEYGITTIPPKEVERMIEKWGK